MSKILNGHNFLSVYAMNTELTSLCCAWSGCISFVINPRRACARGLQYLSCLCVCVCVCVFPYSGTSRNQAYKQQYQRLQRDTGMKFKKGFFFKTLRSEVMASFTHLE